MIRNKNFHDKVVEATEKHYFMRAPLLNKKTKGSTSHVVLTGADNFWNPHNQKVNMEFVYIPAVRVAGTPEEITAFLINQKTLFDENTPVENRQKSIEGLMMNAITHENFKNAEKEIAIYLYTKGDDGHYKPSGEIEKISSKAFYDRELEAIRSQNSSRKAAISDSSSELLQQMAQLWSEHRSAKPEKANIKITDAPSTPARKAPIRDLKERVSSLVAGKAINVTDMTATGTKGKQIDYKSGTANLVPIPEFPNVVYNKTKGLDGVRNFYKNMGFDEAKIEEFISQISAPSAPVLNETALSAPATSLPALPPMAVSSETSLPIPAGLSNLLGGSKPNLPKLGKMAVIPPVVEASS